MCDTVEKQVVETTSKKDFFVEILSPVISFFALGLSLYISKDKLSPDLFNILLIPYVIIFVIIAILFSIKLYFTSLGKWCKRKLDNLIIHRPKTFWLIHKNVHLPWNKYLYGPSHNDLIQRIRYAIAQKYFDQEAAEISGKGTLSEAECYTNGEWECPSVIVTDFINYAELVKTIVHASLKGIRERKQNEALLCFTSLRLSLFEWFNFDRGLYSDSKWSKNYLDQIDSWSENTQGDLVIARHLLCTPNGDIDTAKKCGIEERTEEILEMEINSWIWRTKQDNGSMALSPLPISSRHTFNRKQLVQKIKDKARLTDPSISNRLIAIAEYIEDEYNEDKEAFVIIPSGEIPNKGNLIEGIDPSDLEFEDGMFQVLGKAFSSTYQTKLTNCSRTLLTYGYAKSHKLDFPEDYYAPNKPDKRPPIATDFFCIFTTRIEDLEKVNNPYDIFSTLKPKPLVCLEGQDRAKAVHLALLDSDKNENCMNYLFDYILYLLNTNRANRELFKW